MQVAAVVSDSAKSSKPAGSSVSFADSVNVRAQQRVEESFDLMQKSEQFIAMRRRQASTLSMDVKEWYLKHNKKIYDLLCNIGAVAPTLAGDTYRPADASFQEVKRAYYKLLHVLHPNNLANAPFEQRMRAEAIFQCLDESFQRLRKKSNQSTDNKSSTK